MNLTQLENQSLSSSWLLRILFGYNKKRIYTLNDRDYLNHGQQSIRQKLQALLSDRGIVDEFESIVLVTSPRYFGYVFNPVSFYFCCDKQGELKVFVAEINNTFGDRHVYVKQLSDSDRTRRIISFRANKEFHVSPFNETDGEYRFQLENISEKLYVKISYFRERKLQFIGLIDCKKSALNGLNLLKQTISHPLRVWMSMPLILYQAAILYYRKKMNLVRRPFPATKSTIRLREPNLIERLCLERFLTAMKRWQSGTLIVGLPDGTDHIFPGSIERDSQARIQVVDYQFFYQIVVRRDLGLGDSYTRGYFTCDNLTKAITLFAANMQSVGRLSCLEALPFLLNNLLNRLRKNTLKGSKKNISAHYDLSDRMFELFLDKTRSYSSALFETLGESLEQAQLRKIDSLIDSLNLNSASHVLEIGCGWGALAIRAAKRYKARFTCITLSDNQYAYVTQKVAQQGLTDLIEVRLQDYRKTVEGKEKFDAIVSVEMIEAVGRENLSSFFSHCSQLLKPGGLFALQAITLPEDRVKQYNKLGDWIQLRVFPGCYVPSLACLNASWSECGCFVLENSINIGVHYSETLRRWRESFLHNQDEIKRLGFSDDFRRTWEYYFAYCEAGFSLRMISTYQFLFRRLARSLVDDHLNRQAFIEKRTAYGLSHTNLKQNY